MLGLAQLISRGVFQPQLFWVTVINTTSMTKSHWLSARRQDSDDLKPEHLQTDEGRKADTKQKVLRSQTPNISRGLKITCSSAASL